MQKLQMNYLQGFRKLRGPLAKPQVSLEIFSSFGTKRNMPTLDLSVRIESWAGIQNMQGNKLALGYGHNPIIGQESKCSLDHSIIKKGGVVASPKIRKNGNVQIKHNGANKCKQYPHACYLSDPCNKATAISVSANIHYLSYLY